MRILELKLTLRRVRPAIWRRLHVYEAVTLQSLHGILQTAMGWENRHLHEFVVNEQSFGPPDPEFPGWMDQRTAKLGRLLAARGDRLLYRYDFGDGWEHDLVLERVLDPEPEVGYPRVVAGARACPPEDCGGDAGYAHLLEVLRKPRHPEHDDLLAWVGGAFDPEAFDRRAINHAFRRAFRRAFPRERVVAGA